MDSNDAKDREERIACARARLFEHVKRSFEEASKTPLNIVVCGPGKPTEEDPSHPFYLREAIKRELIKNYGDNAFYIEELLESNEGRRTMQEIQDQLGYEPDIRYIELHILRSRETDKDIHLAEGLGAILELRDFEEFPTVCQKLRIFIHRRHVRRPSYVNGLILRLREKGARVFWFTDLQDLLRKVKDALKPNRVEKYTSQLVTS
jgi:hypothetical protein